MTNKTTIYIITALAVIATIGIVTVGYTVTDTDSPSLQPSATMINDPFLYRITQFITNDTTDQHKYAPDHRCSEFSHALAENMTAAGFKTQYAWIIPLDGNNGIESHLMIRCGNYIIESLTDEITPIDEFKFHALKKGFYMVCIDDYPWLKAAAKEPITAVVTTPTPRPTLSPPDPDLWNPPDSAFKTPSPVQSHPSDYIGILEAMLYRGDRTGIKILNTNVIVYAPLDNEDVIYVGVLVGQSLHWLESVTIKIDDVIVASYTPIINCDGSECRVVEYKDSHKRYQYGWIDLNDGIKNTGNIIVYGTFGTPSGHNQPIGEYELCYAVMYPHSSSCTMY